MNILNSTANWDSVLVVVIVIAAGCFLIVKSNGPALDKMLFALVTGQIRIRGGPATSSWLRLLKRFTRHTRIIRYLFQRLTLER
jgi:hypothetical protein